MSRFPADNADAEGFSRSQFGHVGACSVLLKPRLPWSAPIVWPSSIIWISPESQMMLFCSWVMVVVISTQFFNMNSQIMPMSFFTHQSVSLVLYLKTGGFWFSSEAHLPQCSRTTVNSQSVNSQTVSRTYRVFHVRIWDYPGMRGINQERALRLYKCTVSSHTRTLLRVFVFLTKFIV